MHFLLAAVIGLCALASVASLLLLRGADEPRAGLAAAVFACLAAAAAAGLWTLGARPLGFDAAGLALLLATLGSAGAPLLVMALARTARERNRIESLHWHSMETVRALSNLSALTSLDRDARLGRLLEIGCEQLGTEIGIASRIRGERYEIVGMRSPPGFPVGRGAIFPLSSTWCRHASESGAPVAVARCSEAGRLGPGAQSPIPFGCYLGAAIRVGGEPWGSLAFGSREPRGERFHATEKDLVALMARWAALEIERRELRPRSLRTGARPAERSQAEAPETRAAERPRRRLSPGWRERPVSPRSGGRIDVNAVLRRLERRLRRVAGNAARISLVPEPDLELAAEPRFPLETAILSLVALAADAMEDGGVIEVATSNLELPPSSAGVVPAVAPNRYVTLSIRATGVGADSEALARVFDGSHEPTAMREAGGRLALPTLYRMLQRHGGDLSVDVERGRGSTFTVFLPRPAADGRPAAAETAAVLRSTAD